MELGFDGQRVEFFFRCIQTDCGAHPQYIVISWVQLFGFNPLPVSTYGAVVHVSTTCWILIGNLMV